MKNFKGSYQKQGNILNYTRGNKDSLKEAKFTELKYVQKRDGNHEDEI